MPACEVARPPSVKKSSPKHLVKAAIKRKAKAAWSVPDLTDVVKRLKGDRVTLLREILDPSHKVDAKVPDANRSDR